MFIRLFIRVSLCYLLSSHCVFAVDEEISEPLIVSATRWETSGIPTPGSIKVITRDLIVNSGAVHVTEILQGQGGLQITDLFGDGSRSSIDMRGFGSTGQSNTLILIDGRRINNTDLASPRLNNIFIKDIEQIEITQGSAAVLYGDQAVGGVVNIITRQAEAFNAEIDLSYGSYDFQSQSGHLSHRLNNGLGIRLSAERQRTDGYRDNNKTSYANGFMDLSYETKKGKIFAEIQETHEKLGLPGALTGSQLVESRTQTFFPSDFNDSVNTSARVGGRYSFTPNWEVAVEYTYRDDDVDGVLTGLDIVQKRRQRSFNPRMRGVIPVGNKSLNLILGSDIENTDYILVSPFGAQVGEQEMTSFYILGTLPFNDYFSITTGIRKAWHDRELVDGFRFFPGNKINDNQTATNIGISITPTNSWRFFLKREENYRYPLLDEEMNVFTLATTLKTQTGVSNEAGVEWQNDWLSSKLTGYILKLENEINVDPTAFLENINLDATRHEGLIFDLDIYPSNSLSFGAQYSYTDSTIVSGVFTGNDIPLVAEHQLQLDANYQFNPFWNINADFFMISERDAGGDFTGQLSDLDGYAVSNLNLRFNYDAFFMSARLNNLFDKEYNGSASVNFAGNVGFFPAPERNYLLTIGYTFE